MPSPLRAPATLLAACLGLLLGAALLPAGPVAAQEPASGGVTTSEQGEELARTLASLPQVTSGARPGPDVLYEPAPTSPSLENHHPRFRAAALLTSATEAYVDGEYLYTDYLYDDYGSDTSPLQPNDDAGSGELGDPPNDGPATPNGLSPAVGDLTYPTDVERYGGNAADLVEFRMAPGDGATAYRFTLTTLLAPDAAITALALDTDRDAATGSATLPRDPGAPFPGTDAALEV